MSKLRIKTCDEFEAALRAVPFAKARLTAVDDARMSDSDYNLRPYVLWGALLWCVHEAIGQKDWSSLRSLLNLYDAVERGGRREEMYESSYVAFLEDVVLSVDRS